LQTPVISHEMLRTSEALYVYLTLIGSVGRFSSRDADRLFPGM